MSLLTQSRFPSLYHIFQIAVGGTVDKRRLCLEHWGARRRVLEVGCSVGNIASAFLDNPDVLYTGVDVDAGAVAYARHRFRRHPRFRFLVEDVHTLAQSAKRFDYVLFAGVFHHVSDEECVAMLRSARHLLADEEARVAVVDPVLPERGDSWFLHWFVKLEQGEYLRRETELRALLVREEGLETLNASVRFVGATPYSVPRCARFGVYELAGTASEANLQPTSEKAPR